MVYLDRRRFYIEQLSEDSKPVYKGHSGEANTVESVMLVHQPEHTSMNYSRGRHVKPNFAVKAYIRYNDTGTVEIGIVFEAK